MLDFAHHEIAPLDGTRKPPAERLGLRGPVAALYILSAGHSGSTLLNLLLGRHPACVAVSELTYLPGNVRHDQCTCGQRVPDCDHWRRVARELRRRTGWDLFDDPARFDLGYRDAPRGPHRAGRGYRLAWQARRVARYLSYAHGVPLPSFVHSRFDACVRRRLVVYDAIRAAGGRRVVVDASKEYLLGAALNRASEGLTRLVLLVRDGRAVFHSNLKRGFPRLWSLAAWQKYYEHALPVIARSVRAEECLSLRYEELAADPAGQLARVCEFAGLDYDAAMLAKRARVQHLASGNDMRFHAQLEIRCDDAWQTALSRADRDFFDERAGALNAALGYR